MITPPYRISQPVDERGRDRQHLGTECGYPFSEQGAIEQSRLFVLLGRTLLNALLGGGNRRHAVSRRIPPRLAMTSRGISSPVW